MKSIPDIVEKHSAGDSVNIEGIIRDLGIALDKKADLGPKISGQIERLGPDSYKIAANKDDFYFRQRFTMAHELGHYVLHRDLLGDGTDDGIAYRTVPESDLYNPNMGLLQESQANAFAARTLMPAHLVQKAMEEYQGDIKKAATKIKTSAKALEIRINVLKKSGEYQYQPPV
jgi:Zn-dependent peptidase ImmA (M78 family)